MGRWAARVDYLAEVTAALWPYHLDGSDAEPIEECHREDNRRNPCQRCGGRCRFSLNWRHPYARFAALACSREASSRGGLRVGLRHGAARHGSAWLNWQVQPHQPAAQQLTGPTDMSNKPFRLSCAQRRARAIPAHMETTGQVTPFEALPQSGRRITVQVQHLEPRALPALGPDAIEPLFDPPSLANYEFSRFRLRIQDVVQEDRVLGVRPAVVKALAESISAVGLMNPIHVRRVPEDSLHHKYKYILIAGAHRLEAMKALGYKLIPAIILTESDAAARLIEVDENLVRRDLTIAERARLTILRKETYEALHPETAHGGDRRSSRKVSDSTVTRFTADTAARTGRSERAVQQDARRGQMIPDVILDEITGTSLDKGVILDRLANAAEPAIEMEAIRAECAAKPARAERPCRVEKDVAVPIGQTVADLKWLAKMLALWAEGTAVDHEWFLAEIDPIKDMGRE